MRPSARQFASGRARHTPQQQDACTHLLGALQSESEGTGVSARRGRSKHSHPLATQRAHGRSSLHLRFLDTQEMHAA